MGDYAKAEEYYNKALGIYLKKLGADHPYVATSYNNLAGVYDSQGKYAKAEEYYNKALGIYLKKLGADHPDVATSYNNLAGVYDSQGKYFDANNAYQKALLVMFKNPASVNKGELLKNYAVFLLKSTPFRNIKRALGSLKQAKEVLTEISGLASAEVQEIKSFIASTELEQLKANIHNASLAESKVSVSNKGAKR